MMKGSEIIILNIMEEIPIPSALFTTRVRHHKTGEDTTLSTYFRDLQTDMRHKMMGTLEEVKQKYKNSVRIRTGYWLVEPNIKLWSLQIGRM